MLILHSVAVCWSECIEAHLQDGILAVGVAIGLEIGLSARGPEQTTSIFGNRGEPMTGIINPIWVTECRVC